MISNEQIAHDLAVAWAQSVIEEKVKPKTNAKSMIEEYLFAYKECLEKLAALNQMPHD